MSARSILPGFFLLVLRFSTLAALAQDGIDYTALSEPSYANRLALTDEQRALVANLLEDRVRDLAAAKQDDRPQVLADSNRKLAALLTDEQKSLFATLMSGGKLRFNFRQQEWPDVLDWFARQSDLSLVMDAGPSGTLTYSDTKQYTPTEAIDLLNSVLLSKGFTLMRREKMLLVVDLSEGIPFELAPRVSVEELADRGRFEIVTVEFPLAGRPIEIALTAVQDLIGDHGRVTPLTSVGMLIVTETAGKLGAINEVIAAIPVPQPPPKPAPPTKPPDPVFAVYPAAGLDPQATVETLQGLFPAATIKADPNAEEVHAYAVPVMQEGIRASLEKMTANVSGENRPRLETYPVLTENLTQLKTQLELAVPEAQINVDEPEHRLLVLATAQQHAEIQQTLETLEATGQATSAEEATVAVYQVADNATAPLVTLLEQVLPRALVVSQPGRIAIRASAAEQKLALETIERFLEVSGESARPVLKFYPLVRPLDANLVSAIQATVPRATVTLLDDGRRLSVLGSSEDHASVHATLQQIEADFPQPEQRILNLYRTEQIAVSEVQTLLAAVAPAAEIRRDTTGSRLIVWASKADHETIAATLQQLQQEPVAQKPEVETYELPEPEAEAILAAVQSLVPAAEVRLNAAKNQLVAIGAAEDQQTIADLIEKLTPTEEVSPRVLIAYPLELADPAAVVTMLQEVRPDVQFAADTRAGRVLVTAPLREHPRLQAVIEQLDAAPDSSQEEVVQTYPLKTLNPSSVQELLQPLLPKMRLSVDEASQQLLAAGNEFDHQKLERVLARIDAEDARNGQVQSYGVGAADPEQVRQVLLQLAPEAVVSADPVARRLMVWAAPRDQAAIKQAVDQFVRTESQEARQLRTYPMPEAIGPNVLEMLRSAAPEALLSLDEAGEQIVVWATPVEQKTLQAALEELSRNQRPGEEAALRIHQAPAGVLRLAEPLVAEVAPRARFVVTGDPGSWAVWATATEQQAIAELLTTLSQQVDSETPARFAQIYRLERIDATVARELVDATAADAMVLDSTDSRQLVVLATASQHGLIANAMKNLRGLDEESQPVVRVYPLDIQRITASEIVAALDPGLRDSVEIQVNTAVNSLIVRGSQNDHRQVGSAIDAIVQQLPQAPRIATRIYPLEHASAAAVQQALSRLVENGAVVGDEATRSLLVTATDIEHEQIATLIERLDTRPMQQPVMRAYTIRQNNPDAVYRSVSQAFAGSSDFSVTFQPATGTLLVVATPQNHAVFQGLVDELDRPGRPGESRTARVYPLENIDGDVAAAALNTLFQGQGAEVSFNPAGNVLVVVATASQHQAVDESLRQITGIERGLEVFALRNTDPFVVENAVLELFSETPSNAAPSVSSDYDSQTLFVRGTASQIEQIRQLLASLGEPFGSAADVPSSGGVRTILFQGDTDAAVRQIEQIWNQLRPNPIQIITPSQPGLTPRIPGSRPTGEPSPQESTPAKPPRDDKSSLRSPEPTTHFVSQQTTRKEEPETPRAAPPAPEDRPKDATPPPSDAPVIVVPDEGRITIASPDHEALDQLESLLRAMANNRGSSSAATNFAIYLLRNTGASEMELLLERLFEELPFTRGGVGDVAIAADERLNALVVHGSRKDREIVEQLLEVLDTPEAPEALSVPRPELLTLQNTPAERVLTILQNVYQTQLTSGGGRRPVNIPEGVPAEVASVLQQINAAAAGPLLTLDVDATSNSIVMRAPPELSLEIRSFVEQLDQQAREPSHRQVRVFRLQNSKADRMQAVLKQFILEAQ